MTRRRALVTGITGQDGSYLAEHLLEEGTDVVGVVRDARQAAAGRDGRVTLVEGDLADPGALGRAVAAAAPDEVFHLAAPSFVPSSWDDPAGTIAQIATATAAVVEAARAVGARVLVASSAEVFGDPVESPQNELTPRRPRSPYGVAKVAAEDLVRVAREQRGAFACAVIPYNHESPRRPVQFVSRRITRAAAAISLGLTDHVTLGDLEARRDWTHARDVVRGMVLALRHREPGDYVLAGGTARTVLTLADVAFAAVGLRAADHVRSDPAAVRAREATPLVGDARRAAEVLGWRPEIPFEAMVREMVLADVADLRATSAGTRGPSAPEGGPPPA